MDKFVNECKFCGQLKNNEHHYRIDAKQSVVEIEFYCGTLLKIEVGVKDRGRWFRQCQGSRGRVLDHCLKIPDSW